MVFYRKYRPQKISELDLTFVRDRITAVLKSSDIPHAFLFAGPKGLGKTSAARILAKAINCEAVLKTKNKKLKTEKVSSIKFSVLSLQDIEPCNVCDACLSITNGSNIDVLEIDAASNRGVDEIRDLREKVKFSPASLRKKVYIIDEVHMLTTEAFNALLKTLEEPPAHVLFILATTEMWKLPQTIVSRSYVVSFEKPNQDEIKRSLLRIIEKESFEIENDAYSLIYTLSDGSFRDASKVIEELSFNAIDKKITKSLIESIYKSESIDGEAKKILKHLSSRNAKEAIVSLDNLSKMGVDFKQVCERIIDILRKILLKQAGFEKDVDDQGFTIEDTKNLLDYFQSAYKDISFSPLPQLPLELVVVRFSLIDSTKQEWKTRDLKFEEKDAKKKIEFKTDEATYNSDLLKRLIEVVKKDNHSIAGILRGCKTREIGRSKVEIITPYKFHLDKLSNAKVSEIIEKRISQLLGRKVNLLFSQTQSN